MRKFCAGAALVRVVLGGGLVVVLAAGCATTATSQQPVQDSSRPPLSTASESPSSACVPSKDKGGWYPDPDDHSLERWYDGCDFTELQRVAQEPTTDSAAEATVALDVCAQSPPDSDVDYPALGSTDFRAFMTSPAAHVGQGLRMSVSGDAGTVKGVPGTLGEVAPVGEDFPAFAALLCGDPPRSLVGGMDALDVYPAKALLLGTVSGIRNVDAIGPHVTTELVLPVLWVTEIDGAPTGQATDGSGTGTGDSGGSVVDDFWAGFAALSDRDWLKIAKDPDGHANEEVIVYGVITQFDAATGNAAFRADVSGTAQSSPYGYDTNTVLVGTKKMFADLVQGDQFKAWVAVNGTTDYDTVSGGSTTVPELDVWKIERRG